MRLKDADWMANSVDPDPILKKKKESTYLPILKLMGRITAIKDFNRTA